MRLYELNQAIEQIFNDSINLETGEIIDQISFDSLDELQETRKQKLLNCAKYYKSLEAEEKALKEVKQKFDSKIQAAKKRAESLKEYIMQNLEENEKISDLEINVSYRKPLEVAHVLDIEVLPRIYKKITETADKTALKKALKQGEVLGAVLQAGQPSVLIK